MNLLKWDRSHYETLTGWWKAHDHPILRFESLSPIGLVAQKDEQLVAASFLYVFYGCDVAQIAWTTTNPEAGLKDKYRAIDSCMNGLLSIAKSHNRNQIFCFSNSKGLTKLISKHGLNVGSEHDLLSGTFLKE